MNIFAKSAVSLAALGIATAAAVDASQARGRHIGAAIGAGLVAGAVLGAAAANANGGYYGPGYSEPGYAYGPEYAPAPYAYEPAYGAQAYDDADVYDAEPVYGARYAATGRCWVPLREGGSGLSQDDPFGRGHWGSCAEPHARPFK